MPGVLDYSFFKFYIAHLFFRKSKLS